MGLYSRQQLEDNIMNNKPRTDIIASFAQDASKFAFQANLSQRDVIDLYPLDPATGYEINSSFVSHMDYENTEFKASDLLFLNWCKGTGNGTQSKRKLDDEEGADDESTVTGSTESFFINTFPNGQVVVYSSNGKDIVNIIKNRQEIIGMDTVDNKIWTLDTNKVVKIYDYNVNKPTKTFTLIDGKNEEISNFQVCQMDKDEVSIIIFSEEHVYIIDPSKRRPHTTAQFELFGGICGQISTDGEYVVIADIEKLSVYNIKTQELIKSWSLQVEKLKIFNNYIFALSANGELNVVHIDQDDIISTIKAVDSEVLDFTQVGNSDSREVLIAWLNVNEPNFKKFSIENIISNKEILINEDNTEEEEGEVVGSITEADNTDVDSDKKIQKKMKKASKQEQNEVVAQLISLIESRGPASDVLANITSAATWNDSRITWFITSHVTTESISTFLLKCIINDLQKHIYQDTSLLNTWLKWLLILSNVPNSFKNDKENKKILKHFKHSLKTSSESLPVLLGIQGRLEMLIRQAKLREELNKLSVEDEKNDKVPEKELIEEGEAQTSTEDREEENDDEENITYVNGESDVFVDAQE